MNTPHIVPIVLAVALVAWFAFDAYQDYERRKKKPDKFEELKKWNELREKGVITQEEFDAKKADILDDD